MKSNHKRTAASRGGFSISLERILFDHLDDTVCARIDEYSAVVHNGIAIFGYSVLFGNLVVSDAAGRKLAVRRNLALANIAAKAPAGIIGDAAATAPTPAPT